jgi:hypothetical protein
MKILICLFWAIICAAFWSFGQDSALNKITQFPNKFFSKINRITASLNSNLTNQSEKYLQKLIKREKKLQAKLNKQDTTSSKYLFANDPQKRYQDLLNKVRSDSSSGKNQYHGQDYLANMDSLKVSLDFLKANPQLLHPPDVANGSLAKSINQLNTFQGKLNGADQIKECIAARKAQIKQYLLQQAHLPDGISKIYNQYNQDLFDYSEKIQGYKDEINDPDKMFKSALVLLNKMPAFQDFMRSNSYLAGLFPVPANSGTPMAFNGLQSRSQLQQIFQGRIPATPSAESALNQSVDDAKTNLDAIKDKILKYGQSGQTLDDPNFKPNTEKSKPLLKRLQYEINFQSQPASNYIPSSTNIALGIGYKFKESGDVGVGMSYRVGFGTPFKNIHLSSNGVGFRTYVDLKLKGSIYLSGGYEYNQNIVTSSVPPSGAQPWQSSGLLGLSKIFAIKSKLASKTKIQVLWDFLSYYQIPRTQPIQFRMGYTF